MAGHSKWANIKHKKQRADAAKGKIFTKLGREIAIAVKEGGADPETNSRLRDAIAKAKSNNMPNENINRSIKKASGEGNDVKYEEMVYEGYGPEGVAVIVEAATDNKNRTAGEMRYIFDKNKGKLGETGCVSWMFEKKGQIIIEKKPELDEDELMMMALEAGAEDFVSEEEYYEILTTPEEFSSIRENLEQNSLEFESAGVEMIPNNYVSVSDENKEKVQKLVDMLEDNDDVQNVYTNME